MMREITATACTWTHSERGAGWPVPKTAVINESNWLRFRIYSSQFSMHEISADFNLLFNIFCFIYVTLKFDSHIGILFYVTLAMALWAILRNYPSIFLIGEWTFDTYNIWLLFGFIRNLFSCRETELNNSLVYGNSTSIIYKYNLYQLLDLHRLNFLFHLTTFQSNQLTSFFFLY